MAQKRKKPRRRRILRGTVTPSREPAAFGWVCCAVLAVVLVLSILDNAERDVRLVLGGLMLLTVPLMMTANIRIDYDEKTGFSYRNLLGMKTHYKWSEITAVREVRARGRNSHRAGFPRDTRIELGRRHIRVHWDSHNTGDFIYLAKKAIERREKNAADRSESLPEG